MDSRSPALPCSTSVARYRRDLEWLSLARSLLESEIGCCANSRDVMIAVFGSSSHTQSDHAFITHAV